MWNIRPELMDPRMHPSTPQPTPGPTLGGRMLQVPANPGMPINMPQQPGLSIPGGPMMPSGMGYRGPM
jgi:hypothetical protein